MKHLVKSCAGPRPLDKDAVLAAIFAGLAAGSVATLAQVFLWWCFTDALPGILYRDTRMAAAILLGAAALEGDSVSLLQWLLAAVLHFMLSIAYAFIIQRFVARFATRTRLRVLALGSACGAVLFFINMYVFTLFFPWFEVSREPITFAAHVVFGAVAAVDWLAGTTSATGRATQVRAKRRGPDARRPR